MENVVSARRLRKSMLKELDYNNLDGLDKINIISKSSSIRRANKEENLSSNNKIKINFKSKMMIKILISTLIVFVTLICNLTIKDSILRSEKLSILLTEYSNDWSKELVTKNIENFTAKIYNNIKYVIPEELKNTVVNTYYSSIKPKYMSFNLVELTKSIIGSKNYLSNKKENMDEIKDVNNEEIVENNGVGGAEPLDENVYQESISAISSMNQDIEVIKSKNISMISPTVGIITSMYGARDEIFEGVNSYHTGTDIANKKGTEIKSSTTGRVISVVKNNKYYGNYVEVETNGVIFKYAHMDSINVTENSDINQGDLIGFMGSTGMSTGPHLHFEIKIDSKTVDPQELISL